MTGPDDDFERHGEQLVLSFGEEFDAVVTAGGDVTRWPGYHALDAADRLARVLTALPGRLLSEIGAWLLRLGLAVLGAAAVVQTFPYQARIQGVRFTVQASVVSRPGLSADTTLGNWEFPRFDGLPVGVHVSPQDVDLVGLASKAGVDTAGFVEQLRADFSRQVPRILLWLGAEIVAGATVGLLLGSALSMALRYVRHRPRRHDETAHQMRQSVAATAMLTLVAGYGLLTYNPRWVNTSRLSGTLAAARLFPSQLEQYYIKRSKAVDVLGAVVGIQAALQAQIDNRKTPETAFRIMFISDVHLAAVYPLVQRYAEEYDVRLIVNTGDETEFGRRAELTASYVSSIRAITTRIPMLWLAGNHDSPEVEQAMDAIPGVTVLGTKTRDADSGYGVTASSVNAYGLAIAGLPDPRVYGGGGAFGSDSRALTDPLQRRAVDQAVPAEGGTAYDIFATHEPVAAKQLRQVLGTRLRQTDTGHLHGQNSASDIQHGSEIDLVEGSTGAGGLDNLVRGTNSPPVEFSIESVGTDCQFTRVVRFQIKSPADTSDSRPQAYGDDVTVSTVYFTPQLLEADRSCRLTRGISTALPLG